MRGEGMNQFQVKSLANMAFDLAKAAFVTGLITQIGIWPGSFTARVVAGIAGVILGGLLVVIGLWLGRKIK